MQPPERISATAGRSAPHHEDCPEHRHEEKHSREHGRSCVLTGLDSRQAVSSEQDVEVSDENDGGDGRDRRPKLHP